MRCKSGRTYVRHKSLKRTLFLKNRLLNKMISKNQETEVIFSLEKMHCFLKVLTTSYKEIKEIISTIVMKER